MAVPYALVQMSMLNGEIDTDSANLKWTHHTSGYTPARLTHQYVSSLTSELAAGSGYTVGGVAVTGSRVKTDANSWATARANSTAYTVGQVVRPATGNTFLYRCAVPGTSGASIPSFPTIIGQVVVDGGVTWECVGSAIVVFTTTTPSWTAATFSGVRYSVLSQRDAGTAATQPLLCYIDWVTDKSGQGGAFSVAPGPQGLLHWFLP